MTETLFGTNQVQRNIVYTLTHGAPHLLVTPSLHIQGRRLRSVQTGLVQVGGSGHLRLVHTLQMRLTHFAWVVSVGEHNLVAFVVISPLEERLVLLSTDSNPRLAQIQRVHGQFCPTGKRTLA